MTLDLDIVYERTSENIGRLAEALRELNAVYHDPAGRKIVPDASKLETIRLHLGSPADTCARRRIGSLGILVFRTLDFSGVLEEILENPTFAQKLSFVVSQRGQDETALLAQAVHTGVEALYREALIEAYLAESVSRDEALQTLGPESLVEIEYQRDCLRRDLAWGLEEA